ncbi:hypothetical protein [Cellulomonas sp. PhB150]|nr:hypothetical protein [Cellulomonas sp. PhB150]ROS30445.1 hypothetical protein EDF34_0082 [Cellulomonas sp. PhB150]
MTAEPTPTPAEDDRLHADAPAEGAVPGSPAESAGTREHASDPAEGADDA